jgi:undecaprenyl pyrophosphate phosphatase UppP
LQKILTKTKKLKKMKTIKNIGLAIITGILIALIETAFFLRMDKLLFGVIEFIHKLGVRSQKWFHADHEVWRRRWKRLDRAFVGFFFAGVGALIIYQAPGMSEGLSPISNFVGWVLIVTSVVMTILRWPRRPKEKTPYYRQKFYSER